MENKLSELTKRIPEHLVIDKALWCGNVKVDINHIDNDLSKPLNYIDAFEQMIETLGL